MAEHKRGTRRGVAKRRNAARRAPLIRKTVKRLAANATHAVKARSKRAAKTAARKPRKQAIPAPAQGKGFGPLF